MTWDKQQMVVLLFGAGAGQLPYLRYLHECGHRVAVVDRNSEAPGVNEADYYLAVSTYDADALQQLIEKGGFCDRIAAIVCPATGPVYITAARISAWLNLPYPAESSVRSFLDKYALWQVLRSLKLSQRQCARGCCPEVFDFSFPVVVKPRWFGGASLNVRYCRNRRELVSAIEAIGRVKASPEALVETYCPGDEIKLAGFIQEGKVVFSAIARRSFSQGPLGLPIGLAIGESEQKISHYLHHNVVALLQSYCRTIGLTDSSFNVDIILNSSHLELIDVDLCLGSFCSLFSKAYGLNALDMVTRQALGEKIDPQVRWRKGAAVTYIYCVGTFRAESEIGLICSQLAGPEGYIPLPVQKVGPCSQPVRVGSFITEAENLETAARAGCCLLDSLQRELSERGEDVAVVGPVDS